MSRQKQRTTQRRKTPQRTCVICRNMADKRDLLRIVRTPTDGVQIDTTGKMNGRGAYVCRDQQSCDGTLRRQTINNALKTSVSDSDWEQIQRYWMDT